MELTYPRYLRLDELLSLQEPRSDPEEHDELLFIVIHQVYELWFRVLLHELDKIGRDFSTNDLFGAIATFKRARTILKTLVGQLDILETMTPLSFAAFRDRLDTSSGFQSTQYRELEFLLGYKRARVLKYHKPGATGYAAMERRLREPSIVDRFYEFLEQRGLTVPQALKDKDSTEPTRPDADLQRQLLQMFRSQPDAAILLELMMDLDEGLQEWRYRHIKIVERTIGRKTGTGGSPGVDFLKQSLFVQAFPDLWAIRQEL